MPRNSATNPSASPKVRAPKLAQKLVTDFADRIHRGILLPGSKLPPEFDITREFRVSRAVVREAISRLHAAGLVEARHGVGTFVLEPPQNTNFKIDPATVVTIADVLALLELRISFETESASLAAQRHTPDQLREMEVCIETIQQHLETDGQTTQPDFEFHLSIARATHNRYYVELINHLGLAILPRARIDLRYIAGDNAFAYLKRSNQEHREILRAISARDAEAARDAMRVHLSNSRERLRKLHDTGDAGPAPS